MIYYIIDGYNVTHTHVEYFPGSIRSSREKLIELIRKKRPEGSRRNKITVFFDGQPGIESPQDKYVDIRFADGKEADWHIKKLVENYSNPRQIIVVTDDRAIIHHISAIGAKTMSTYEFINKLFPRQKQKYENKVKELKPEEIKEINEEFLRKKGLL